MCKALSTECQHRVSPRFVLTLVLGDEGGSEGGKRMCTRSAPTVGRSEAGEVRGFTDDPGFQFR